MNQVRYLPWSETWAGALPLWFINSGYPWYVRHHVPKGSTVLELGCAGGVLYFAQRYQMIGADVSLAALRSVSGVYQLCLQVDAASGIPLPDESVDAVTSSYFWEHMPELKKRALLLECHRVLRPKGKIIFLYDVETFNPLIARLRARDAAVYRRQFLEKDGHLGYHTLGHNRRMFEDAGFRVHFHAGLEKSWLQSPSVFAKLRFASSRMARVAGRFDVLGNSRWALIPYSALVRLFDTTLGRRLPSRWARIALSVCEKA